MNSDTDKSKQSTIHEVMGCFSSNSLPKYPNPPKIPDENRIRKLFSEFEIKKIGLKKVTERIREKMGAKFNCNRVEADWITSELIKPNKETQDLIDLIEDFNDKSKVVELRFSK